MGFLFFWLCWSSECLKICSILVLNTLHHYQIRVDFMLNYYVFYDVIFIAQDSFMNFDCYLLYC